MAPLDHALRVFFPGARDRELDFILWNLTAFPLCGPDETILQLLDVRQACGSSRRRGWWRKVCRQYRSAMAEQVYISEAQHELAVAIKAYHTGGDYATRTHDS